MLEEVSERVVTCY